MMLGLEPKTLSVSFLSTGILVWWYWCMSTYVWSFVAKSKQAWAVLGGEAMLPRSISQWKVTVMAV